MIAFMDSSIRQKLTGEHGEKLAAAYLEQHGYRIRAVNWRCKSGEIDIVAQQGEMLVFVEVKTRQMAQPSAAFENITWRKRSRLIKAAHSYLAASALDNCAWRIDAVAVVVPASGQPVIEHIEDALDWLTSSADCDPRPYSGGQNCAGS
jgi:putative endonuclease